jgi:hypothetical protein
MSYETPDGATLTSSTRASVAEALSNVVDPTPQEKRQFVYERQPDTGSDNFDDFPYLYLEDYSVTTDHATVNSNVRNTDITITIIIEAKDDGIEAKPQFDSLIDEVNRVFLSDQRVNLGKVQLSKIELETSRRTTGISQGGMPVLRKRMSFSSEGILKL